mmetsp:Transcript_69318/g.122391  ORF Transcript_69318/g.122391 Transcript_69318/m.122391 type:complete len:487 (+) Transcript_69318:4795-6255(+)
MATVAVTEGGSTSTCWNRRSRAGSFSTYLRYSSRVVAPMQRSSPRASIGFRRLPASIPLSPPAPAPTMVWISSMKRMMFPALSVTSRITPLSRSSNSPRNLAPATSAPMSRAKICRPLSPSGTSPATIRWARPSATAVFPTPGSPMSTGLFFVLRDRICMQRRISSSRPITGSSLPVAAASVRSRAYFERASYWDSGFWLVTRELPRIFLMASFTACAWIPNFRSNCCPNRESSVRAHTMCSTETKSSFMDSFCRSASCSTLNSDWPRPGCWALLEYCLGCFWTKSSVKLTIALTSAPTCLKMERASPPCCPNRAFARCSVSMSCWLFFRPSATAPEIASKPRSVNSSGRMGAPVSEARSEGRRGQRDWRPWAVTGLAANALREGGATVANCALNGWCRAMPDPEKPDTWAAVLKAFRVVVVGGGWKRATFEGVAAPRRPATATTTAAPATTTAKTLHSPDRGCCASGTAVSRGCFEAATAVSMCR